MIPSRHLCIATFLLFNISSFCEDSPSFRDHFLKIRDDWSYNLNIAIPQDVDSAFNNCIVVIKSIISYSSPSAFDGWTANAYLGGLNSMFLLTGNTTYLDDFVLLYRFMRSARADLTKTPDYRGNILPFYYRTDSDNIFSYSPYYPYSLSDQTEIMAQRNWISLKFSDINYSGLYLDQMLRFAQIIRKHDIVDYHSIADEIISEAAETMRSHEAEWINLSPDEGYYIFCKNAPFYLDGVEIPINEAAVFGTSLMRMYLLTQDTVYLKRSRAMFSRWSKFISIENGLPCYPYTVGHWYNGWTPPDSISVNSPAVAPNTKPETFHKASLLLKFISLLSSENDSIIDIYLKPFYDLLEYSTTTCSTAVSPYPTGLDLTYPENTFHTQIPIIFSGWVDLASFNRSLIEDLMFFSNRNKTVDIFGLVYAYTRSGCYPDFRQTTINISPFISGAPDSGSFHILSPSSSKAIVTFKHMSPKHNILYLLANNDEKQRIRLDISGNVFRGTFYPPRNMGINLHWMLTDKLSYPSTRTENTVQIDLFSKHDTTFNKIEPPSRTPPAINIFPNPLHGQATISIDCRDCNIISANIISTSGKVVKDLSFTNDFLPNNHSLHWHGDDAAGKAVGTGIYYCTVRTNTAATTRKILLLK